MTPENKNWRQQLSDVKESLIAEEEKARRREENETSRFDYQDYFEETLSLLTDADQIIDWRPAGTQEKQQGIHYFIETEKGDVPLAIHSTHRHAQRKRKKHPELSTTTLSLRPQRREGIKPHSILETEVMDKISDYLES